MKLSILYSFLVAAIVISGCRKDDNAMVPDLQKVPIPLITLGDGASIKIPGGEPATFTTTFIVDTYFKNGELPKQLDVVVVKNGVRSNPKVIQAAVTSYPTTITLTGQQLIDLFGEEIGLGDAFEVGADVYTQDGKKFEAFPVLGETYAPGIANLPGSNTQLRFAAPCLYDESAYTEGDYEVILDEWNDFAVGDPVAVKKIDATHFSFKYAAANANPIVFEVNAADNSITIPSVMYGDYDGAQVTAAGAEGSEVDPCDVSFKLVINHNAPDFGGDLGNYTIILKKL